MNKMMITRLSLWVVVITTFVSCSKSDDSTSTTDTQLVEINAKSDFYNELDFNVANDATYETGTYQAGVPQIPENNMPTTPPCADITIETTNGNFPKMITIDFGNGCTNANGITRKGILKLTLSNYLMSYGSTLQVERINYYINNVNVQGTILYQNQTTIASLPTWNRTVTNGKLIFENGNQYTFSGTRNVSQIEGFSTVTLVDNVYQINSGTHTITSPSGNTLTATVLTPLRKSFSCNYVSAGSIQLTSNVLDGTLDYGTGTCDNTAQYTHSNGSVYIINL